MKMLLFNGSPRKSWNTAKLLKAIAAGAEAAGADTETIHLYDIAFRGCISCMECKRIGGRSFGKCAMRDDLTPVLEKIDSANAIVLGSPIYFGNLTGEARSFLERALYPYLVYGPELTLYPRQIPTALVCTMNVTEEVLREAYLTELTRLQEFFGRVFGLPPALFCATDTRQVNDYAKYDIRIFDGPAKVKRDQEHFPQELERAFVLGGQLVAQSMQP